MAPSVYAVARSSHGCCATAGSCAAAFHARAATTLVICSEGSAGSAPCHHGPEPAVIAIGTAIGSAPSGRVERSSQSHSSMARGVVAGATSWKTSKACRAAAGWLSGERRSPSSPQP